MRKKRNKQLSIFIILFIFILGMYFDNFKVDSCFAYVHGDAVGSGITTVAPGFTGTHACTAEMLRVRGDRGSEQFTFRLSNLRRDTGKNPGFLCQNFVFLYEGRFCSGFGEIQFLSENQNELVTNFIHKSDGKKRI